MLKPHHHKEKIIGNSELEDFVFRLRRAMISTNQAFGFGFSYFDHITEIRRAIEDSRPKPSTPVAAVPTTTKVSHHDLWEPDHELTQWFVQSKVRPAHLITGSRFNIFSVFRPLCDEGLRARPS